MLLILLKALAIMEPTPTSDKRNPTIIGRPSLSMATFAAAVGSIRWPLFPDLLAVASTSATIAEDLQTRPIWQTSIYSPRFLDLSPPTDSMLPFPFADNDSGEELPRPSDNKSL
ncbi:hypothetical protein Lser_V15G25490 [Lactuca serriola]